MTTSPLFFTTLCCSPLSNCIKHKLVVYSSKAFKDYVHATNQLSFFVNTMNLISTEPVTPASSAHLLYFCLLAAVTHFHFTLSMKNLQRYFIMCLQILKDFSFFFSEVSKSTQNCPAATRIRPLPNMLADVKPFIPNPFCVQVSPPLQHITL